MPSVSHQRQAARYRHAAAIQAKAKFWTELDRRYIAYQASFTSPNLKQFCAIARQQCSCQQVRPFRISTYLTWLRAWSRQRTPVIGARVESNSFPVYNHDAGFGQAKRQLASTIRDNNEFAGG